MLHTATQSSAADPDARGGRRHTFLVADLAGFTALPRAAGGARAAEVTETFVRLVRPLLARHGAERVETSSDALLARTDEARGAVELGLEIVDEVQRLPESPIARVGMHTAAVDPGGDRYWATVRAAAGLSGAAAGGEVLLTEATLEVAGEIEGVELERHGEARVGDAADPVTTFRAVRLGETRGRLVIDPVCRMVIAPRQAAGQLLHGGVRYRFCSLRCVAAFASEPERYVRAPAEVR